jgi:hypothetical protein
VCVVCVCVCGRVVQCRSMSPLVCVCVYAGELLSIAPSARPIGYKLLQQVSWPIFYYCCYSCCCCFSYRTCTHITHSLTHSLVHCCVILFSWVGVRDKPLVGAKSVGMVPQCRTGHQWVKQFQKALMYQSFHHR